MSNLQPVKCDICGESGILSDKWVTLRDFAYLKHACPECARKTDDYGGSHLHEARLATKVRSALRRAIGGGE